MKNCRKSVIKMETAETKASMYNAEEEDSSTTTTEDNEDVETVKNAGGGIETQQGLVQDYCNPSQVDIDAH